MSTSGIVVLVLVIVIVLAVGAWLMWTQVRRRQLRERFGTEYDRALTDKESRGSAERELAQREKRHAELDIKPLSSAERDRYAQQWDLIQQQFVDHPGTAVIQADRLVTVVMGERGYPTEDYRQQLSDLSVRHASVLDHYRDAHDIRTRSEETQVPTEELREAMVNYRFLFEDLLEPAVDDRTDENERSGQSGDSYRA
jgi:type II secretory pathway pseudopilin PulG